MNATDYLAVGLTLIVGGFLVDAQDWPALVPSPIGVGLGFSLMGALRLRGGAR